MRWNAEAVSADPHTALRWAITGMVVLELSDIVGTAISGVGLAVTNAAEFVAYLPVLAWTLSLVLAGAVRLGYVSRGSAGPRPRDTAAILAAGGVASILSQIRPIMREQAKWVYMQYADYPLFLFLKNVMESIQGPVIEEILFRGLMFAALLQRGRLLAYTITTGVFLLWHVSIMRLIVTGNPTLTVSYSLKLSLLSLLTCFAYERTQRLWVPLVIHSVFNAAINLAPLARYGIALLRGESF